MKKLDKVTIKLDPEWKVFRRFECGHMVHACCEPHLDDKCPLCE